MRTITQQSNPENPLIRKIGVLTITAALVLAMAFTFNACSSDDSDDNGSLESLLANELWYQQEKIILEYYIPTRPTERCTAAGVVEFLCKNTASGDVWYNPLKQRCRGDNDGFELGTYDVCGGKLYRKYPSNFYEKCENNVLLRKCGNEWYNVQTQQCEGGSIEPVDPKSICNGYPFDYEEGKYECRDGVVKYSCGSETDTTWYKPDTEYCDRNDGYKVKSKILCSGGMYYIGNNHDYERCSADGKTLEFNCGDDRNALWFNPITQDCMGGKVIINKTKCSK